MIAGPPWARGDELRRIVLEPWPCIGNPLRGLCGFYATDARAEHRSIRLLEAGGYGCTGAAASLGIWDIMGVSSTNVLLVQVKSRDWPSAAEMAGLLAFAAPAVCRKLVHRWRDR